MVFGLMFGMFPQVADEEFRRAGRRDGRGPRVRPDRPGRDPDRDRHVGAPRAGARRLSEPQDDACRALEDRESRRGVDDAGERQARGREQRAVLLLGALPTARHHQHVEVGERRLHLEARASQDGLHHEHDATGAQAARAGARGSRRSGRPASRAGSTSAGRRPPPAPRRRSCRSPPTTVERARRCGGSVATTCARSSTVPVRCGCRSRTARAAHPVPHRRRPRLETPAKS